MEPTVIIATADQFVSIASDRIAGIVRASVADRGTCALALCGGNTPRPVYQRLAAMPLPWSAISVWFGDERAVAPDDARSNYRMAAESLLGHAPIPPSNVHRMPAEQADLTLAADAYAAHFPDSLDLLLLGMGPDGHVASLFPGSAALAETERRVIAVASPPPPLQPQVPRLTIAPPVIAAAREIVVMATGADKAAAVARALRAPLDSSAVPAQLARRGCWVLDPAAAAGLTQSGVS